MTILRVCSPEWRVKITIFVVIFVKKSDELDREKKGGKNKKMTILVEKGW